MSLSGTARPNQARILLFSSLRHSHVLSCTLHPTALASCEYLSNNSNGYIRKPVKRSLWYRRVPAGDFPAATRKLRDLDHAGSFLSEFWDRRCPSVLVLPGVQSHRGAEVTCLLSIDQIVIYICKLRAESEVAWIPTVLRSDGTRACSWGSS